MAQQTILVHFDSRSDAQAAMDALVQAGIGRSAIRMLPEASSSYKRTSTTTSYDHTKDEGGFWASLGDMFLPDEDRYAYAEGMSRGGVTVAVTGDESDLERMTDIVERHGAVDMDERETMWKREGWTGWTGGTTAAMGSTSSGPATRGTGGEETIPLVEEQMRVGKRQVQGGRVKLRSYTVETPVNEQVNLRTETVHVERRPVDRAAPVGADAFRDRTIEATTKSEEAVVSKEARVTGEVLLKKDVNERTETVSDTVRRTEVEVDDDRGVAKKPVDTTKR